MGITNELCSLRFYKAQDNDKYPINYGKKMANENRTKYLVNRSVLNQNIWGKRFCLRWNKNLI